MPSSRSSIAHQNHPAAAVAGEGQRNSFLDAVRAVAILRVVLWHTYGYAWLSYFIASMPAMFFVAGSLMARSLSHRTALAVGLQRFRRLLLPLWLMGFVAVSIMLFHQQQSASPAAEFDEINILWWFFPIWDPGGSEWGITWWTALWYLRCLTWLLLVSPLLFFLWKRLGPALLLLPLIGLAATEYRVQTGAQSAWQVQDFALYGFFWLLGFAYDEGRFARIGPRLRMLLCAVAVSAAAGWTLTHAIPGNIVNASYPLHLFVGLAWLFGALAFEPAIAALARRLRLDGLIYWVNERALSIYLWQAAGLFVMYQLLWQEPHSALTRALLALPIVASVTFVAVLLFGWVEDVAAGRRPRLWPSRREPEDPRRRAVLVGATGGLAASAVVAFALLAGGGLGSITDADETGPTGDVQARQRVVPPSGAGLRIRTGQAQMLESEPKPPVQELDADRKDDEPAEPLPPVTQWDLQAELEAWTAQWNLPGATVTLARLSGESWTGAAGYHDDGTPFEVDEPYWIASLTKTFTSALVMRLVEADLVRLDEPVQTYFPAFPDAERFTVRQLLQHTSGLVVGDEAPVDALAEAMVEGLQFEPGTSTLYSRAAYYLLGLMIEDMLRKPYTTALREELLSPLGLGSTFMDEEIDPLPYSTHPHVAAYAAYPGAVHYFGDPSLESGEWDYRGVLWSSGGIWSTTGDMAHWALSLWGTDRVVRAETLDAMTTFLGPEFDLVGLGTYAFCPCWQDGDRLRAERWGHLGANGVLEFDHQSGVAIATHISGSILEGDAVTALDDLSSRLRRLTQGREIVLT